MVRVRKLVLAIAAASALTSGMAHALGLGEISLKSALNQPLDAEIELLEVRDLGSGEVIPSLAAIEEFNKVGVDRNFFLTDLKFTPVLKPNGKSVIRVTSSKPVREPYLNFLVEVLWPNGRLLREYTVLLDPPLYSPQTVAAAAPRLPQTQTTPLAPVVTQTPRPAASAPRAVTASPAAGAAAAPLEDGQYRVGRDDTLWEIAERARPSKGVSVHQTMLAIQDLNPNAFFDGNINRLKNNQVLRLPSDAQVRSRSQADALAQVQAQNVAWREGRAVQPAVAARQLDATRRSQAGDSPAQAPAEDSLRLLSADAGEAASGSDNGAAGNSQALADKLALNQESLASTERENQELKERLGDLQGQLDKLQRLIALKNEQLAKLQGSLANETEQGETLAEEPAAEAEQATKAMASTELASEQPAAADADGEPSVAVAPAAETEQSAQAEPSVDTQAAAAADSQPAEPVAAPAPAAEPAAPAPVAEKPKPKVKPQPAAPVYEPSLIDDLLADPLMLAAGGGGLALLVGLGLLVNGRRRKQAAEEAELFDGLADDGEASTVAGAGEGPAVESIPDMPIAAAKSNDPLGEAEMYSAYGRFTQAAELLRNAINDEPQRTDLRLKLMEVCAEMGDREGFVRQEAELGEIGGAQPQIDQLRARYPQILASAAAIAMGSAVAADALDFETAEDGKVEEPSFDGFTLDDLTLDDPLPSVVTQPSVEVGEASDDIGLGLDDLEAELERELAGNGSSLAEAPLVLDELTLDDSLLAEAPALPADLPAQDFALQRDALEMPSADLQPVPVATSAQDDEGLFAELDQLGLDQVQLTEAPLDGQDDQALFAGLDQLELDGALLSDAPAAADALADLDSLSLAEPVAEVVAESAEDPFAELDQLALDDVSLAEVPSALGPVGGDDDQLLALDDLEQVDLQLEEASPVVLGEQEPQLESLELSREAEQDLDAAFDEFLAQSATADSAGNGLPSLDDLVIEPVAPQLTGEEDFNFLDDTDETATKLELARAYIDMGDADGARDILDEVLKEGSANQQQEAREMMGRIA